MSTNNAFERRTWNSADWQSLARAVDFLALLTAGFYLHAFLTNGLAAITASVVPGRETAFLVLLVLATAGLVLAWFRAGWGGLALISGLGLALIVYNVAEHYRLLAAMIYGSPFVVTGALFLFTRRARR